MSMVFQDTDIRTLKALFSAERLAALTNFTRSEEEAINLHQATLRLNSALMNVIASIEIALRNATYDNLSYHFSVKNWLQQPPVAFNWKQPERQSITRAVENAKRANYAKLTQSEKAKLDAKAFPNGRSSSLSHFNRARARQRQIPITEGKVIAELTFFFWKRLFGPEYEQSLWKPSLKRVFPDKTLKRPMVAIELERLYQARNRLAHHEPVLDGRFREAMAAIDFITQRLGLTKQDTNSPLARLLEFDIADVKAKELQIREVLSSYKSKR